MIEEAIRTKLINDAAVAALVTARVFPGKIPERDTDGDPVALPAVVYRKVAGNRDHTLDGPAGWCEGRFFIKCFDDSFDGAKILSDAIRKDFDGYFGTVAGVDLLDVFLDSEFDEPAIIPGAEELKVFCKVLDFRVSYREST
jgi:hypothetical protein